MSSESRARVDAQIRERLPKLASESRDRLIETTVDFLRLCAAEPGQRFAPAPLVDEVFHTMVLDTRPYRDLCGRLGVDFIDHEPVLPGEAAPTSVAATVERMKHHGFFREEVADLWPVSAAAKCCGSCAQP